MCHKLILLMLVDRKGCVILLFLNRLDFLKSDKKGNRIRSDELKKRLDRCSVYFPLITDESTSEGAHLIFVNEPKVKNDVCKPGFRCLDIQPDYMHCFTPELAKC